MPFRARLRKTFSRESTSGASDVSTAPPEPKEEPKILYYKPGERIPYKYRRPVEPAHKEKLESFSFDTAWRRRSWASEVSPMSSRLPTRQPSIEDMLHPRGMRRGDVGELADDQSFPSDTMTLSRTNSSLQTPSAPDSLLSTSAGSEFMYARHAVRNDTPFSAEDLTLALEKSRLEVPP